MCSLTPYSWPSKCQIQVTNSQLLICTGVSRAPCFWPHLCQIPISRKLHECVSGAGRLPGQCACHILLVAVRIWRTLMFYQVLSSAVCQRHTWGIQYGNLSHSLYTVAGISSFACQILASMCSWAAVLIFCSHGLSHRCISFLDVQIVCVTDLEQCSHCLSVCHSRS